VRKGKCGLWFRKLLTFVVYDSRMLPPQSNSLTQFWESCVNMRSFRIARDPPGSCAILRTSTAPAHVAQAAVHSGETVMRLIARLSTYIALFLASRFRSAHRSAKA
jgi:hypothetical protein